MTEHNWFECDNLLEDSSQNLRNQQDSAAHGMTDADEALRG